MYPVAQLCPISPPASVCADHYPDQLWRHLAMYLPSWLVILPDWIYDFIDRSLHKLLHSGNTPFFSGSWDLGLFSKDPPETEAGLGVSWAFGSNLVTRTGHREGWNCYRRWWHLPRYPASRIPMKKQISSEVLEWFFNGLWWEVQRKR